MGRLYCIHLTPPTENVKYFRLQEDPEVEHIQKSLDALRAFSTEVIKFSVEAGVLRELSRAHGLLDEKDKPTSLLTGELRDE